MTALAVSGLASKHESPHFVHIIKGLNSLVFFYFVIWAYALKTEYINLGFGGDKLLALEA